MPSNATKVIIAAVIIDLIGGVTYSAVEHVSLFTGLYWAIVTATTVGYGDVIPHNTVGRVVAIAVMLTAIPLFAAAYSLFTTKWTEQKVRKHVEAAEDRIKAHVEHHIGKSEERIKAHVSQTGGKGDEIL